MTALIITIIGIFLGSFTEALVWRIHEQARKKSKYSKKELSILSGRSMCPNCGHKLGVDDLVPVLSWVVLRGKCRYCHKPIGWQALLIEIALGGLFLVSYLCWPQKLSGVGLFDFIAWLILLVGLFALVVYDARWTLLPDRITRPLVGIAVVKILVDQVAYHQPHSQLLGYLYGAAILFGLFYLLFQLSGGAWIGGGDVKLGLLLGLIVSGPLNSLLLLFFASTSGTLVAIPQIIRGKSTMQTKLPFGPFLIFGCFIMVLFGQSIISWYKAKLLH